MRRPIFIVSLIAILGLSGCLQNNLQRGVAGAAVGAVAADATGGSPLTGAVVGGAVGATCNQYSSLCR